MGGRFPLDRGNTGCYCCTVTTAIETVYRTWTEVQTDYPSQWLLIEALEAHSANDQRILDKMMVLESFPRSSEAMKRYGELHRASRNRELYVLHTQRKAPSIMERWRGIRGV